MRRATSLLMILTASVATTTAAQDLDRIERIQLSEGLRLIQTIEPRWDDWSSAPSAILLVKDEHEFLIGHPYPPDDFSPVAADPINEHQIFVRDRTYSPGLLATFPAVAGVATIVVGTPSATGLNSTRWILTLLHEHFHQFQMSQPWYFEAVDRLELSGGDETGMWMLNFPFPYSEPSVARALDALGARALALAEAIRGGSPDEEAFRQYAEYREATLNNLSDRDARYLSFQLWQEGIARHVEATSASIAAEEFEPSRDFASLSDFTPFQDAGTDLHTQASARVRSGLAAEERSYFYSLGALEGAILDEFRPSWRAGYLSVDLSVAPLFGT